MTKGQTLYLPIKRIIGICGSIIGIILMLIFVWWWVFIINLIVTKGHPIFVHKRIGKNKKVFGCLKFRSMNIDANPNLPPSDMTVKDQASMETKFGKFLRKTSIDESLQLFNILIGDMAFVGPRPGASVNEDNLVIAREKYTPNAFDVKPGITGLAQVKMKRDHSVELKAKYDFEYVTNISLWLDIKLFFETIFGVFFHSDGAR